MEERLTLTCSQFVDLASELISHLWNELEPAINHLEHADELRARVHRLQMCNVEPD